MASEPYTKVTIEADDQGRISINALDEAGGGHGHRLAGRKFDGTGKPVAVRVLTARDVKEIRQYLAIWDRIQARQGGDR
jgi:hypothetical protein